jgi:hypothetical protein
MLKGNVKQLDDFRVITTEGAEMRKILLLSIGIILCASIAYGQAGYIGLYSDPAYTTCDPAGTPGIMYVYCVHKATPAATASQWKLEPGAGFNCMWLADTPAFTVIGNTQSGIAVAYGGCYASDILMVSIFYNCLSQQPVCASLTVVPDPGAASGTIEVADCGSPIALYPGGGGASVLYANADVTCDCGEIVPTKETSWGQIKSLYN